MQRNNKINLINTKTLDLVKKFKEPVVKRTAETGCMAASTTDNSVVETPEASTGGFKEPKLEVRNKDKPCNLVSSIRSSFVALNY